MGTSTYVDKDGLGMGFTFVQANKDGTEYQPSLIDLDPQAGVIRITTTGTSLSGSNWNADNTLVNALGTQFNATAGPFAITTRVKGPLSHLDIASEQGGIWFGPNQDNYIKLTPIVAGNATDGTLVRQLQFVDEQTINGVIQHTTVANFNIGNFATIWDLELRMIADPATGTVTAAYAINNKPFVSVGTVITVDPSNRSAFFSTTARAGIYATHKNDVGPVTIGFGMFSIVPTTAPTTPVSPRVTAVRPGAGETNVSRDAFVATDLLLPNTGHGVDTATLNDSTVRLVRTGDGAVVPAHLNTSAVGDVLVLQPMGLLDANTHYTFQVTSGLTDTGGIPFVPFTSTFTTGTAGGTVDSTVAFEKVALPTAAGQSFTTLAMGPDGRLYAGTYDGKIMRWSINANGTLGQPSTFSAVQSGNGGAMRTITGIAFAPGSTAGSATLYVSHGAFSLNNEIAPEWSGKVSRVTVTSSGVSGYQDVVVNLPRSIRDHLTNQIAFGPDGALYVSQGSNSAYGQADAPWGLRPERLLSAAILRIDLTRIAGALNVKTEEGGTYNPFASNAAVTLYATGVRNAYDLVFHSNGKLYVPTNGSAAGGNTPAYPNARYTGGRRIDGTTYTGPNVAGLNSLAQTEEDWLFQVVNGGYYGHPNPIRGEFVLNGGNPTSGIDPFEVPAYPVGTQPDVNYRGNAARFGPGFVTPLGKNYSPNGVIEYQGDAFGGRLKGKLLIVRYSGGDDVIAVTLDGAGGVAAIESNIAGLGGYSDPLDLVEGPNGVLYVTELGASQITLVRPIVSTVPGTPGAKIETSKPTMVFNDPRGGNAGPEQTLTIRNTGTASLVLPADALAITGVDAAQFLLRAQPSLPTTLAPGASVDLSISFNPPGTAPFTVRTATLVIKSNDLAKPSLSIDLRGLPTAGTGGQNEPSLQRILDLWNIRTNVGDNDANTTVYPVPNVGPNDEVVMPRLLKADASKPVSIEVLAVMGVSSSPAVRFGYHGAGSPADKTELLTVSTSDAQSVQPFIHGLTSFDPGSGEFGFYTQWPGFLDAGQPRVTDTEDQFNAWESIAANRRKARFFLLRDGAGNVVPNAYVLAFEEYRPDNDLNDFVAIVRNVRPPTSLATPEIGFDNLDGVPFNDRLIFNQIRDKNPTIPNEPHAQAQVRINNSGGATLNISSIAFTGPWALAAAAPTSIPAGGSTIVTVRFTATSGTFYTGSMTINSNDANEPSRTIELAGHWQVQSEGGKEPLLPALVNLFGYKTIIVKPGQVVNNAGRVVAIGDEVLSPFWVRASANHPVTVRQLAAYHSQGGRTLLTYYAKGTNTQISVVRHAGADGQSILPNKDGSTTAPAYGEFNPSGAFGWKIDTENSDDTKNVQEQPGGGYGHHVRFFLAKDRTGAVIPNTWLMVMDYSGINYDFNDNVYVITNIRPDIVPAQPQRTLAISFSAGVELRWQANTETDLTGYNVYRGSAVQGPYTKLNTTSSTSTKWFDTSPAIAGATYFYKVTAIDSAGNESAASLVTAIRQTAGTGALIPPVT